MNIPSDPASSSNPANSSNTEDRGDALQPIVAWMQQMGQQPFDWQREAWTKYLAGHHGLILASTGMGKTRAAWLGPLAQWIKDPIEESSWTRRSKREVSPPLQALWITPLRALAADTCHALQECIDGLQLPWTLEQRTGDTSSSTKLKQRQAPPTAMVITPESLTLLLSYPESRETFRSLRAVVVDEWHELLGSKRGIQTELALAHLAKIAPNMQRWALSATIGNPEQALNTLVGTRPNRPLSLIAGGQKRAFDLQVLLPEQIERFPWAGHIGLSMLPRVIEQIEGANSTLVFTNTRNQTELWYRAILHARPQWAGRLAVHHGSLAHELREWVEQAVSEGKLIAVVCTSSLDLGVDFAPVDQVIQVGSPKGTARLVQRAGRSGHSPGRSSKLAFVPSHAFEIIELEAARLAIESKQIEERRALRAPLDCLVQHAVTMALGSPYTRQELFDEVSSAYSYREITQEQIDWVLDFVTTGGCLHAYPDYRRVVCEFERYCVKEESIAKRHRMAIGTITADMMLQVQMMNGSKIGFVEESFASKLKPGDRFLLGGRVLQLEWIREGAVWVKKGKGEPNAVPRWLGGNLPLSSELSAGVRRLIDRMARKLSGASGDTRRAQGANAQQPDSPIAQQPDSPVAQEADAGIPEGLKVLEGLMRLQRRWSHLPKLDELLVERHCSREGDAIMIYPFEGRSVSEGLGALLAYRISKFHPLSISISVNDYGLMLFCPESIPIKLDTLPYWLRRDGIEEDILSSLNATEMTRRGFRDIARISGLIHHGMPGRSKSMRHLQASATMVFDVLKEYDPENLLLHQARQEVLADQLQIDRLRGALDRMHSQRWEVRELDQWTPFSFPLMVERVRDRIGSESLADRIRKMQGQLEAAAVWDEQAS
jgi:ATP-dependent Lhr-like helicase